MTKLDSTENCVPEPTKGDDQSEFDGSGVEESAKEGEIAKFGTKRVQK